MEDSIKSQSQAVYQADGVTKYICWIGQGLRFNIAVSMLLRNRSEYNRP